MPTKTETSTEKTYDIRYYDMDKNKVLKPSSLMNFLQDIATINAEELGFGDSFAFKNGLAWFLIKYRFEFLDYPCGLCNLRVKTQPRGTVKLFAFRDFEIYDGKKLIGKVASTWTLVDLATKSILNIKNMVNWMFDFQKQENDLKYDKIRHPEKIDFEKTFEIRFDDIDINQHVNNANYLIWGFEALPYEFRCEKKLKTLDINYKKEIAYGNSVVSQVEFDGITSIHILKNAQTNEDLCFIKAVWG